MSSLECSNEACKKMLAYDKNDNLLVVASSNCEEMNEEMVMIDCKCSRCKRHNIIVLK